MLGSLLSTAAINVVIHILGALPQIEADLKAAFAQHWGKDHVQDALRGADLLSKIVQDVADGLGQAAPVHVPSIVIDNDQQNGQSL